MQSKVHDAVIRYHLFLRGTLIVSSTDWRARVTETMLQTNHLLCGMIMSYIRGSRVKCSLAQVLVCNRLAIA